MHAAHSIHHLSSTSASEFNAGLMSLLRCMCCADFKPVQRELVIDIDMTDYDELRTCGSGGHICSRCWPFIAVAIQVRRHFFSNVQCSWCSCDTQVQQMAGYPLLQLSRS
jgi:hypothetical protein